MMTVVLWCIFSVNETLREFRKDLIKYPPLVTFFIILVIYPPLENNIVLVKEITGFIITTSFILYDIWKKKRQKL